ncbi:MAG TPA: hypothetical protein PKV96_01215 [Candidatus Saccharimonas sp.]|jgi:hypothetical protein|nr:hypothetical protein [Candidatus Saccharimonas sp.]
MGVIYSTEAVSRGHLPKPGAHSKAADHLLVSLFDINRRPSLLAGMIYGSVALNNALRLANGWQYIVNRLVAQEFPHIAQDVLQ